MRRLRLFAAAVVGAGALSCSNGATTDRGTDAFMQMPGGQFVRGPMPPGSSAGPAVAQILLVNNNIWAGFADDPLSGALSPGSTAAAIGLEGDLGYWIRLAGVPSVATPTYPSLSGTLAFSQGIILGSYTLVVRAVNDAGNFGLPSTQILVAETSPTNPPATGELVVTLTWDSESNLALHVVDPNGAELDPINPSSQPAFSFNQVDGGTYGYIDYNSNANCVIDGRRAEDAIWAHSPPSGQYTVRVDAPTLCGQPIANWEVFVFLHGSAIAHASGVALEPDTRGSHGTGSGVLALQFTVP